MHWFLETLGRNHLLGFVVCLSASRRFSHSKVHEPSMSSSELTRYGQGLYIVSSVRLSLPVSPSMFVDPCDSSVPSSSLEFVLTFEVIWLTILTHLCHVQRIGYGSPNPVLRGEFLTFIVHRTLSVFYLSNNWTKQCKELRKFPHLNEEVRNLTICSWSNYCHRQLGLSLQGAIERAYCFRAAPRALTTSSCTPVSTEFENWASVRLKLFVLSVFHPKW